MIKIKMSDCELSMNVGKALSLKKRCIDYMG